MTLGLWAEEAGVSDAPPADGPTMVGRYLLGPCCGRGGMGAVFRSTDRDLGREVAIKVMAEELRDDPQSHERFHRERRACARMDHGNVVRVHDAGVEDGLPFLVMEWLEGMTLYEILRRRGALPIPDAVAATLQALEGLWHAHRRGVIHRDVKPQNLLLTRDGVVKVLDWGISRFLDGVAADEAEFVTRGFVVLGTPEYMAPERMLQPDCCDVRSDLFSVGTTLFQLLAGYPPSEAKRSDPPHSHLMAHAQAPPPLREARPGVPADLARVVHHLLEKVADARPSDYDEVIESLRPFAAGANLPRLLETTWDGPEWSHPRTAAPAGRPPRPPRRRGLSASLRYPAAWLAVGLAGASLLLVWPGLRGLTTPTPPEIPSPATPPLRESGDARGRTAREEASAGDRTAPATTPPPALAPGVLPRPPASEPPELGVVVMEKDRRIFHAGDRIRVRVTSVRDCWLLAYQIPVVGGLMGAPTRLLPDARDDAPRLFAGRAFELGEGEGAGGVPLAGPIGRGLIVLVGSPRPVVADEADQVGARAMSGLEGAPVFPRIGPPALPDGWTCRVVRYDVLEEPVK